MYKETNVFLVPVNKRYKIVSRFCLFSCPCDLVFLSCQSDAHSMFFFIAAERTFCVPPVVGARKLRTRVYHSSFESGILSYVLQHSSELGHRTSRDNDDDEQ